MAGGGRPAERRGRGKPHLLDRRRARRPRLPRHRHPRPGRALLVRGDGLPPARGRAAHRVPSSRPSPRALAGERAVPGRRARRAPRAAAEHPSHDRAAHRGVRPGRGDPDADDDGAAAAAPQVAPPDRADGHRWWPWSARSAAGRLPSLPTRLCPTPRNFLYMLKRPPAERGGGPGHGRGPGAARRPRVQRLDLRGPRGRLHPGRRARRHHRRHRHPEGAAARRGQRGGDEDAGERSARPTGSKRWVQEALAQKKKIMGFGHAVYRTEDPRATHLRRMSGALGEEPAPARLVRPCRERMEDAGEREKGLYANVDFYSASAYHVHGDPHRPLHARVRGLADRGLDRPRPASSSPTTS